MADLVICAIILAKNEEQNIKYCLESLRSIPTFVVDSGSTDETLDICKSFGVRVFYHPYSNHANQWDWALHNLPVETPWILAMDADFVLTPMLYERICRDIGSVADDVGGIYIRHLYEFGGGKIRFGGTKQFWLRIIRRNRAFPDKGDLVDFRFNVDGRVNYWREPVVEYNRKDDDISVWLGKQDKFAFRLAVEEELRRRSLHSWDKPPSFTGTTDERFAWLRDRWLDMPLFARPVFYFVYRYVLAGGFLDGRAGFLYHALQGFWLRLIVDWKIFQIREAKLKDEELTALKNAMLETSSGSVADVLSIVRTRSALSRAGRDAVNT